MGTSATQYHWIRVDKILILKRDDKLDEKTVAAIAESILLFDLLHPIAVRRVTEKQEDGEAREKIVLVAGAHRLKAVKRLGQKKVPCFFVKGDETDAQLVRLGENLWRKTLTVLRHAEGLVEYLNLASARVNLSGQPGQKSKLGRPPGGIALAARELPLVGRSAEARRKIINRAIKINQITPEAKKAAIEARLDNNQRALLKIAKSGGQKAQLRMVAELAEIANKLNAPLSRAAKRSAAGGEDSEEAAAPSPPLQPDATPFATSADDPVGEETDTCQPSQKMTTFDEMLALWKSECRASWAYLPSRDRERFIEMLRRARCKSQVDVVEFLNNVLRGREQLSKRDLFGFAATHGFAKNTIQKALKQLGYRTKRKGQGWGSKSFVRNPDRGWQEQLPFFSGSELRAAGEAQSDPRDTVAAKKGWTKRADYFEGI
jgi:ParB-like nuclease domain